jgi:hypothetical protein
MGKISGVPTSSLNSIDGFYSTQGGGGGTATTTPTITLNKANTYTGNGLTVTNTSSYTDVRWKVNILNASSTVIATEDDCVFGLDGSNNITIDWGVFDGTGTHTVEIWAQEFGDFIDSVKVTDTYTVDAAQFAFWRCWIADSSGTKVSGSNKYIHIDEWDLYESAGQTGALHPNVALTSNTSSTDYEAARGWTQYDYPAWKAFDNATNTQAWTLGASAANNWVELEMKQATTPTIASMRVNLGSQLNGTNGAYLLVEGSTTGAFSGEEKEYALIPITATGQSIDIG